MHEPKQPILIGERVKIQPRGKKGIFTADFWFDGQHHRRSLRIRNFKVARQKALQLENQLLEHSYQPAPPSISLGDAIEAYREYVKTENRGDSRWQVNGAPAYARDFLAAERRLACIDPGVQIRQLGVLPTPRQLADNRKWCGRSRRCCQSRTCLPFP